MYFSVKQIISKIKKYKKNIKIRFIKSPIMNKLTYLISSSKLNNAGLKLGSNIDKDIKETLNLFKNIKNNEM